MARIKDLLTDWIPGETPPIRLGFYERKQKYFNAIYWYNTKLRQWELPCAILREGLEYEEALKQLSNEHPAFIGSASLLQGPFPWRGLKCHL